MRWEMAFASRVLSGEKVLGSQAHLWTLSPGHPRREWEVSFGKNPYTSRAIRGVRKSEL